MMYLFLLLSLCFSPLFYAHALVKGDLGYIASVSAGEEIPLKITLENNSDIPEEVNLQLVDYTYNAKGENFFTEPGLLPRSNARWIDMPIRQVLIPPHQEVSVSYVIRTPNDTSLKGSYWSVVLIEPNHSFIASPSEDNNPMQLLVKVRYAYQIITTISNGTAKLKISPPEIIDGKQMIIDVANSGEVLLQPRLDLKIYNSLGKFKETLTANNQRLLPGTSMRYFLNISQLQKDRYTGFAILDNGNNDIFGRQIEFEIP